MWNKFNNFFFFIFVQQIKFVLFRFQSRPKHRLKQIWSPNFETLCSFFLSIILLLRIKTPRKSPMTAYFFNTLKFESSTEHFRCAVKWHPFIMIEGNEGARVFGRAHCRNDFRRPLRLMDSFTIGEPMRVLTDLCAVRAPLDYTLLTIPGRRTTVRTKTIDYNIVYRVFWASHPPFYTTFSTSLLVVPQNTSNRQWS